MKAYEILGYSYDADIHCLDCAIKRFGAPIFNEANPPDDNEGNEVQPVFASDFDGDSENCSDCAAPIFDAEDEDEDEQDDCDCDGCLDSQDGQDALDKGIENGTIIAVGDIYIGIASDGENVQLGNIQDMDATLEYLALNPTPEFW